MYILLYQIQSSNTWRWKFNRRKRTSEKWMVNSSSDSIQPLVDWHSSCRVHSWSRALPSVIVLRRSDRQHTRYRKQWTPTRCPSFWEVHNRPWSSGHPPFGHLGFHPPWHHFFQQAELIAEYQTARNISCMPQQRLSRHWNLNVDRILVEFSSNTNRQDIDSCAVALPHANQVHQKHWMSKKEQHS